VYSKADFPVSEGKVIVEEINVAKMLELLETRKDATDIIFGHDFYVAKA
jgi:protein-L-isoaspartate O-methyltransferase